MGTRCTEANGCAPPPLSPILFEVGGWSKEGLHDVAHVCESAPF